MNIKGKNVTIRRANISERKDIYFWLTQSDLTSSILGPPLFPDHPVPSYEEFCNDYDPDYFNASGKEKGQVYIITVKNKKVGTIGYDLLNIKNNSVSLDIWMRAEKYCGKGYGSDAINTLCNYLYRTFHITRFFISPSQRNKRAVAAYKKCGFVLRTVIDKKEQIRRFGEAEYNDNVIMEKIMKI